MRAAGEKEVASEEAAVAMSRNVAAENQEFFVIDWMYFQSQIHSNAENELKIVAKFPFEIF